MASTGGEHNLLAQLESATDEGGSTLNAKAATVNIAASAGKLGFYETTAIVQRADASQVAVTDNSGGTASDTIAAIEATYTQATIRNAFATLADKQNEIRTVLVNLGLMKGSA